MTCFWNAIVSHLNTEDFKLLGINSGRRPPLPVFINQLKERNKLVENTSWQGKSLRNQELKEHFEAIKCYNVNGINNGHLTSICDSFLLLLCELLVVNIDHRYLNTMIKYKTKRQPRKTLRFNSNRGHFSR